MTVDGPALAELAARLRAAATTVGAAGHGLRSDAACALGGAAWLGAAGRAARLARGRPAPVTDQVAEQLRRAATALDTLGAVTIDIDRRGSRLLAEAEPTQWTTMLAARQDADAAAAATLRMVATELLRLRLAPSRSSVALLDPAQSLLLRRAGLVTAAGQTPATQQAAAEIRALLGRRDPVALRAYIESLSAGVRAALVAGYSQLVGSGDGIPPTMRYAANRLVLAQALVHARRCGNVILADRLRQWLRPGRQILLVDVAGGRIAEALGDLDTASHVAVVVPGMCNDLANFDAELAANARHLHEMTCRSAPGRVATIAWLGYRTPGLATAPFDDDAVAGAGQLRDLVAGLVLRAGVTTTVVAHSYGSLLTARALSEGLRVDAVVVLGSPGMGARTAAGLQIPPETRLFAARAPGDPVAASENFGRDPSDPRFGIPRIATGDPSAGGPTGHSGYLRGESECLRNLSRIVTGRYDQVTLLRPAALERLAAPASTVAEATDAAPVAVRAVERAVASDLPAPLAGWADDAIEAQERADHLVGRLRDPDLYAQILDDAWSMTK